MRHDLEKKLATLSREAVRTALVKRSSADMHCENLQYDRGVLILAAVAAIASVVAHCSSP
jgi:hypothetical protein